jgi:hypothetical protein
MVKVPEEIVLRHARRAECPVLLGSTLGNGASGINRSTKDLNFDHLRVLYQQLLIGPSVAFGGQNQPVPVVQLLDDSRQRDKPGRFGCIEARLPSWLWRESRAAVWGFDHAKGMFPISR